MVFTFYVREIKNNSGFILNVVNKLKNCHALNINYTKIIDDIVKELKNCHALYLISTNIRD
jgi:hypothetical protein